MFSFKAIQTVYGVRSVRMKPVDFRRKFADVRTDLNSSLIFSPKRGSQESGHFVRNSSRKTEKKTFGREHFRLPRGGCRQRENVVRERRQRAPARRHPHRRHQRQSFGRQTSSKERASSERRHSQSVSVSIVFTSFLRRIEPNFAIVATAWSELEVA